jgi:hypothetical protein
MPAYEVRRRRFGGRKLVARPHGLRELVWAPSAAEALKMAAEHERSLEIQVGRLVAFGLCEHERALGTPKPVR